MGRPLPVSWDALGKLSWIGELTEAGVLASDYSTGRLELLAKFAASLLNTKWDPEHVSYDVFFRGLMADRDTPARLRNNPELRKAYPPKRLEGLMSNEMAEAMAISEMLVARKARQRASGS